MISAQQLDALEPQMRQAMQSLLAEIRTKDELIAQRERAGGETYPGRQETGPAE